MPDLLFLSKIDIFDPVMVTDDALKVVAGVRAPGQIVSDCKLGSIVAMNLQVCDVKVNQIWLYVFCEEDSDVDPIHVSIPAHVRTADV